MSNAKIHLTSYRNPFGNNIRILRLLWVISYYILFRPFTLNIFREWRSIILRMWGAKIGKNSQVSASVKIWAPWNLSLDSYSCIGPHVDCYNQGKIIIGSNTIISQKTYLCASTHNITKSDFSHICKSITIGDQVWIAADAFIGPGVCVGEGAVVGARSAVFKNVDKWTVVGGNPAKFLKKRIID